VGVCVCVCVCGVCVCGCMCVCVVCVCGRRHEVSKKMHFEFCLEIHLLL